MLNYDFKVVIREENAKSLTERKHNLVEALAYGFSNKAIAGELNISIKSVERIISELNQKYNQGDDKIFNPRMRVLLSLLNLDILDYEIETETIKVSDLTDTLYQTLVLTSIGFTNKLMADIFGITEKAIEMRLSQLFDLFNVDTKSEDRFNARVELLLSAYLRNNIKKTQLKRLYKESQGERLKINLEASEKFLLKLDQEYNIIGF